MKRKNRNKLKKAKQNTVQFLRKSLTKLFLFLVLSITVVEHDKFFEFLRMNADVISIYLEGLIVWPLAILIIAVLIIFNFKTEIKAFLSEADEANVGKDGVTFKRRPQSTDNGSVGAESTFSAEQIADYEEKIAEAITKIDELSQSEKKLKDFATYLLERSKNYEFKWLDKYLVPNSKQVLMFIESRPNNKILKKTLINSYEIKTPPGRSKEEELGVIVEVLVNTQLLKEEGNYIELTPKGHDFLKTAELPNVLIS